MNRTVITIVVALAAAAVVAFAIVEVMSKLDAIH